MTPSHSLDAIATQSADPVLSDADLAEWITALQQSDQTLQDMMSLEIWSVIQTMDELMPGFWNRYMANRQAIVQQAIQARRHTSFKSGPPVSWEQSEPPEPTGLLDDPLTQAPSLPTDAEPAPIPTFSYLPHLQVKPTAHTQDWSPVDQSPYGIVRLTLACWFTSHFWCLTDPHQGEFVLHSTDTYSLQPGASVICALGFQFSGIVSPVKVKLVRSPQTSNPLSATWMADLPWVPAAVRRQINECAVQLHNRSDRIWTLQAGQPFCQLECYWSPSVAIAQASPSSEV